MIESSLATTNGARRTTPPVVWLRSPARPALQVTSALDRVRRAPTILHAMRSVRSLLATVDDGVAQGVDEARLLEPALEAIDDPSDTVTAIAAIHALARLAGLRVDAEMADLLLVGLPAFGQHAAWALGDRGPAEGLVQPLVEVVARGGLPGMHAQRALARWAPSAPMSLSAALDARLSREMTTSARQRLAETLGLVPGRPARRALERIALDPAESMAVRATAVLAFSERPQERLPSAFAELRRAGDELAAAVRTTTVLRHLARRGPREAATSDRGIRVAQVHLGPTGGLATLLPRLGGALAARSRVGEVTTIVRAPSRSMAGTTVRAGHRLEQLYLEPGDGTDFTSGWPSLVTIARGIRGAVLAGARPDLFHLRMADPGSLAAASVAREMSIPLVFTLAADPHRPIAAAEAAGTLDRKTFATVDAREGCWFRVDLVERLAREAQELVLFPHDGRDGELESLMGIDLRDGPPRHTTVAEGIDTARIDEASDTVTRAAVAPPVLSALQHAISRLPRQRHGLPLVVSAGRLHPIKGMSRLVEAFAGDGPGTRANLVILGGDLADPEPSEATELARIRRLIQERPGLDERVVLLGHRTNDEVTLVMAAARAGWGELVASNGAYACASEKEEFGLALVEGLAAGLPVVAPRIGGPSRYVEPGRSGHLVDTTDRSALSSAIDAVLDLASDPATARRARATVDARYTLSRMARDLTAIYRVTTGARILGAGLLPEDEAAA